MWGVKWKWIRMCSENTFHHHLMWGVEWKCIHKHFQHKCEGLNGNVSWKHATPKLNVRGWMEICPQTCYTNTKCERSNGNVSLKHVTPTLNVRGQREMCPENTLHHNWTSGVKGRCVVKIRYTKIAREGSKGNVSWKHVTPTLNVRGQREMCPGKYVPPQLYLVGSKWKYTLKARYTIAAKIMGRKGRCWTFCYKGNETEIDLERHWKYMWHAEICKTSCRKQCLPCRWSWGGCDLFLPFPLVESCRLTTDCPDPPCG